MNEAQKPVGYGHGAKGAAGGETKVRASRTSIFDATSIAAADQRQSVHPRRPRGRARKGETICSREAPSAPTSRICATRPSPAIAPDGNCRACMVEIEGERVLAASCIRTPSPGMKVKTQTDRAKTARKMVARIADFRSAGRNATSHDPDWNSGRLGGPSGHRCKSLPRARALAAARPQPSRDGVNLDACIQCNLCVRACREVQVNDVIGMAGRGHYEKIVFDFDDPMGASTCVACGECVQACPTGALMPATLVDDNECAHRRAFPGPRGG